ncbi:MAG: acetoacetate decarboxylase family protein, partial [Candidatus Lokiarchaeota archaeon]|nr:acetoacetate decarboxylase family protein [Candidatus Lokiarchaeota archaeon]
MSFRLTAEEFKQLFSHERVTFTGAQMAWCIWEADPAVYKKLLPSALVPLERPLVAAFVATYPKTNFSMPYKEAALFLV